MSTNAENDLNAIDPATGLPVSELIREMNRREAVAEANADPLPGPLAAAFVTKPIRVGLFSVRAVTAQDIALLRQLDSPLLKQMAEARKPVAERTATPFSDEDGWMMALQFLLPIEQAEAEINQGTEHFKHLAREKFKHINPVVAGLLATAAGEQFAAAFETALKFSSAAGEPADNDFFTKPLPTQKTASAGGSPTSAA